MNLFRLVHRRLLKILEAKFVSILIDQLCGLGFSVGDRFLGYDRWIES
ncbi:hypothetical protein LEP3755_07150 [Leptolyngbya sp. NIES-3755]|nr:hypothetical protein LEP3755_07150 [Leptolyngbya sp. NIES-3755]